jgi:hypothetical protein
MQEDYARGVAVLLGHAQAYPGRLRRTSQRRSLGDSLARSPVESLTHWNGMHGCELCVAIAAQRQCVLEGGLRRPREVHGTQNARGSRHGDLLQEDGRRGANLWTVARSDGALTDAAQSNGVDVLVPMARPRRPLCIEARWTPSADESKRLLIICKHEVYMAAKKMVFCVRTFHNEITGTF